MSVPEMVATAVLMVVPLVKREFKLSRRAKRSSFWATGTKAKNRGEGTGLHAAKWRKVGRKPERQRGPDP